MAIYYCVVTNISRGGGLSAVGAAAYRANEIIKNEYDGRIHNYKNKHDLVYKEILVPDNAPWWSTVRKKLWNEVERIEKASNSRLAREIKVALPKELSRDQQIEVAKEYCKESFVSQGMIADLCIHDKGDGNPHAHIMLTTRSFDEKGKWQPKSRKSYILDNNGDRIQLPSGEWKSRKIDLNDWNTKERLEFMREDWAKVANRYLPKELYIDHRSYKEQGIEKIGMIHLGPGASALEKKGIQTEKGNINRGIQELNKLFEMITREYDNLEREKADIYKELETLNNNIDNMDQQKINEGVAADRGERESGNKQHELSDQTQMISKNYFTNNANAERAFNTLCEEYPEKASVLLLQIQENKYIDRSTVLKYKKIYDNFINKQSKPAMKGPLDRSKEIHDELQKQKEIKPNKYHRRDHRR